MDYSREITHAFLTDRQFQGMCLINLLIPFLRKRNMHSEKLINYVMKTGRVILKADRMIKKNSIPGGMEIKKKKKKYDLTSSVPA